MYKLGAGPKVKDMLTSGHSPAIMGYKNTKPQREMIVPDVKEKRGHLYLK